MSNVELNEETRARLDKYVEERGAFPLHLTCETYDDLINGLLDKIDRLEYKCESIEQDIEVLFDACLISIQKNDPSETVTDCKDALVRNVALACGNDYETKRRLMYQVRQHNKTRRYDDAVFSWRC